MKTLSCKDVGIACDFVARGNTVDEVLRKATEHGKKVHAMKDTDLTPDKIEKIKTLIHEEGTQQQQSSF